MYISEDMLAISLLGFAYSVVLLLNLDLAHKRRRSRVTWFFLTLFFGFFATIMLLLAEKVERRAA